MSAPREAGRLPGWVVLAFIALCAGAIGGGIYYLLQTQPPGSAAATP
ncbi:MAG: hypothetical protein KC613_15840 [Myxococcales bacterium]|nr:hypothetical protein [Myxococcales bacterium]MCB9523604.1 hypothetical protein [Myxococcales bacterium]